jgi:hypothetical protein
MIASPRLFPRTSTPDAAADPEARWSRFPWGGPLVTAAFGFLAFLPYPAIPAGSSTGVQFGSLLTLVVALPCLLVPWRGRPYFLAPLLLAPLTISLVKIAVTDGSQLELGLKSLIAGAIPLITMMATQRLAPRDPLPLLTGIAAATLLHVVIGAWQAYAFTQGYLPLQFLYVNPSFLSVQDNAATIVQYIRRPFGLFPEPSAMSSSLAPWVVLWLAEAAGVVRLRQAPGRLRRALYVTAAVSALALILLSRSGHAMVLMAALLVIAATWLVRARATPRTAVALLAAFCVVLPAMFYFGIVAMSDRFDLNFGGRGFARVSEVDESWQTRSDSLRVGLNLVLDGSPATWIFGLGPGLTTPGVQRVAGYEAVWSVLLPYVYQTGLIGLAVILWVGVYLIRVWRADGYGVVYPVMLGVWLVGITITTSYGQLLPLTVALGWITTWPSVFQGREVDGAALPASAARRAMRNPLRPWSRPRRAGIQIAATVQAAAP